MILFDDEAAAHAYEADDATGAEVEESDEDSDDGSGGGDDRVESGSRRMAVTHPDFARFLNPGDDAEERARARLAMAAAGTLHVSGDGEEEEGDGDDDDDHDEDDEDGDDGENDDDDDDNGDDDDDDGEDASPAAVVTRLQEAVAEAERFLREASEAPVPSRWRVTAFAQAVQSSTARGSGSGSSSIGNRNVSNSGDNGRSGGGTAHALEDDSTSTLAVVTTLPRALAAATLEPAAAAASAGGAVLQVPGYATVLPTGPAQDLRDSSLTWCDRAVRLGALRELRSVLAEVEVEVEAGLHASPSTSTPALDRSMLLHGGPSPAPAPTTPPLPYLNKLLELRGDLLGSVLRRGDGAGRRERHNDLDGGVMDAVRALEMQGAGVAGAWLRYRAGRIYI